ncbi:hypothetical protein [Celeribacter naphthalenivorans]|uniref:hypothetical protein n=1 Tax=Celeribacter naphthalenivorans TaxID=1614694 RepID=UPI001CF950CA|nr:hypothetical protein [Celeribacter naphthalenivorans]
MTFTTPQTHINTTDAELRREHAIDVLRGCLVAVACIGALIATQSLESAWTEHNAQRLEQEQ